MKPLTREEQRAARAIGGWMVAQLLAYPQHGWTGSEYGGSSTAGPVWPDGHGKEYTGTVGRIFGPYPDRAVVAEVRWKRVAAHAFTLALDLRRRLIKNREQARQHQRDYPRFTATGIAVGCGRPPRIGPMTEAQAAYDEQYEAHRPLYLAWVESGRALDATQAALLDEAFPLAGDDEPTDLLELLDAEGSR